jgi:NAD(P)-dependent dehydrogenase (short-subunit alcohol dehydrogenase family)
VDSNDSRAMRLHMRTCQSAGYAVVVTGAAGGIGGAIVGRLLSDGWRVVAADIQAEGLERLATDRDTGGRLRPAVMDVTASANVAAIALELQRSGIRVAGLVNAAGLLQDVFSLMSMNEGQQRRIWDVNYFGTVSCIQHFGPMIVGAGGGSIINITSINELRPLPLHAYAPTKVALGALTSLAAGELGANAVRVNAIAPGFTLTPIMREKIRTGKRDVSVIERSTAMGRLVEMDEIAAVASFLMSDDASAVTGVSIPVDAGWLATSHWMNFRELRQDQG